MPLVVNTNIASMTAQRHLGRNTNGLNKSLERLSSGFRINRASDDAAGLQISENLRSQIRGSKKALDNVQDGINMLNIVDGAYQTIGNNLQRMRELAVQAANDTYGTAQRVAISQEMTEIYNDIDRIARTTIFNGVELLSPTAPANFFLQVAPNSTANDEIDIANALGDATMQTGLGVGPGSAFISSHLDAQNSISTITIALERLNQRRGDLGAVVNRLDSAANNLAISIENQSAAESRLRDADIAYETSIMTRNQILQQSSAAILQQANQVPSLALQLLQG